MLKLVLFLVLLAAVMGKNWQASGNFTVDNITFINYTIDDALFDFAMRKIKIEEVALNISNVLNAQWDLYWNVAVTNVNDAVFYGYAFRYHWYWLNGFNGYSFIVWKDYKCNSWIDINNPTINSGYIQATPLARLRNLYSQTSYTDAFVNRYVYDIWRLASDVATAISVQPQDFSVISFMSVPAVFVARMCAVKNADGAQYYFKSVSTANAPLTSVAYFVFQTR